MTEKKTNTQAVKQVTNANEHDLEIEKVKAEIRKYELEIVSQVEERKLIAQYKHEQSIRSIQLTERLLLGVIVATTIGHTTNKHNELAKYEIEYGQE